ncbi:Ltp family lipoprotein [Planococcus sp. NCCP-2050]|uniref:Ltp family lipoprotein n=1 Tax=Planococcus sp. NCCP-2050 TaxID=2944679 RepID=UPI00203E4C33|nr:Ltp family lipoprotein [Planococcus sp. NCCP-2050]GKW47315.1 hypothetical protein NCCP2050_30070 [Planococcus sp. NCCP-2050]
MGKINAFVKTKWKYLLAVVIAFAVGGSHGFLQSPTYSSTTDNQKKQEKLEASTKELASKVEALEAANSESDKKINELKAQLKKMETPSQQQAVARADNFLKYSPFSESGLIEQLVVAGYSEGDAMYAVQSLEVDWQANAVEEAEGYVKYGAFSRKELIDQLKSGGYSEEDATYAVDSVGL